MRIMMQIEVECCNRVLAAPCLSLLHLECSVYKRCMFPAGLTLLLTLEHTCFHMRSDTYCRFLELMYDVLDKDHLEGVVAHLAGKHSNVIRQATNDARELQCTFEGNDALARCVRCAAYATVAALLRSTQSKAAHFASAFKGKP